MFPSPGILPDKEAKERLTLPHSENISAPPLLPLSVLALVRVIIHELIFPLRDLGIGPFVSISKWIANAAMVILPGPGLMLSSGGASLLIPWDFAIRKRRD